MFGAPLISWAGVNCRSAKFLSLKNLALHSMFFTLFLSTDAPTVTERSLQHYFSNSQESCPNVPVTIEIEEIQDIATLTYKLNVSSSDGCVLQECPMLLSPGERIVNMTLMDGVNYTAMLTVSNDCGSGSTAVSIHPGMQI